MPPDPRPQPVLVGDPGRISGKRREPARRPDAAEGSRSSAMPVRDGRRRARALHRRWRPEAVRPIGKRREPACKPGSVGGSHSSATHVAVRLSRPTRERRGPRLAACRRLAPLFGLAPGGVCPATGVATGAVRSYRTFSPLPHALAGTRRSVFCGTFRGLAPPRRYLAPCPVEPGLSSASGMFRDSGCPAGSRRAQCGTRTQGFKTTIGCDRTAAAAGVRGHSRARAVASGKSFGSCASVTPAHEPPREPARGDTGRCGAVRSGAPRPPPPASP